MYSSLKSVKYSYTNRFNKKIEKLEEKGIQVLKINLGQPCLKVDKSYYNSFKKIKRAINGYSDCRGSSDLRSEFSNYYNEKINSKKYDKDNVQITLGASDAIINTLASICNPSDSIVIIEPFFSDYNMYCQILNIQASFISIDDLKNDKIILPNNCKAILFSNPNNPSGYILDKNEIGKIINLAKGNNLYIISDEVYSEIVFEDFISMAEYNYDKIVIVDSVSKKFNNCGARIGCIIAKDEELLKNVLKIYDSRISISNMEQLAIKNMFQRKDKIFKKNLKIFQKRKRIIEEYLKRLGLEYENPKGGIFFLVNLPVDDSEEFSNWVLDNYTYNKKTFFILPAKEFYAKENPCSKVRLSIVHSTKYTIEALNLLKKALNKYKEVNSI